MSKALDCLRELHAVEEEMSSHRIVYGVALTLISVVSLVMNTLLLFVLFNDAMDKFFRLHLLSAALSGLVGVVPILSALLPAIFFNWRLEDPTNIVISVTDTLGYLTLTMTTTAIAFDRFVFFLLPKVHRRLSDNNAIIGCFAAIPWVATVILIINMTFSGCHKRTDPYALTFTYSCSVCTNYGPLLKAAGYGFPAMNFVIYLIVYCRILALRHEFSSIVEQPFSGNSVRKNEMSLVIQFSLICLIQFGSSSFFYLLPLLTNGAIVSFHISMVFSTINTVTNPIVIFVFQKRIRKACLVMLRLSPATGDASPVSLTVDKRNRNVNVHPHALHRP